MRLRVLCSGFLVRLPLGGHTWHHLQYLLGLQRLGHEVLFFEHYGWEKSCYDVAREEMTDDPSFGIEYLRSVLEPFGLSERFCYLSAGGRTFGRSREELVDWCRKCDLYLNLSNINWIDELELCRRRVLVDTDPVFTQIGTLGMGGEFGRYHTLLTYGENVHRPGCEMPTAGQRWLPTRQPVVLDAWPCLPPPTDSAPLTTLINWSPIPDQVYQGRVFGQKSREFEPFLDLPRRTGTTMRIAVNAPRSVTLKLQDGGWQLENSQSVSRTPWTYQQFIAASRGEFCVAKHGYVATHCGWFSDRSTAYLATGRPVVVQDTGFSEFLPCGRGLIAYRSADEARAGIEALDADYACHCIAARKLIEEHFDSDKVLSDIIEKSL